MQSLQRIGTARWHSWGGGDVYKRAQVEEKTRLISLQMRQAEFEKEEYYS